MTPLAAAVRSPTEPFFAPIVYRLAAHLEQLDVEEMLDDPASAAYALRGACALFGLPLIVSHYQLGLELVACGATVSRDDAGVPRAADGDTTLSAAATESHMLGSVVDTAARLSAELRDQADVVGVLTGPATLSALSGRLDGVAELYAVLARRYAEAHVAALLVAETPDVYDPDAVQATCGELVNICRFYGLPAILLAPAADLPHGQFDATVTAGDAVPPGDLALDPGPMAWRTRRGLLLTAGEVPETLPPEQLSRWTQQMRSDQRSGR